MGKLYVGSSILAVIRPAGWEGRKEMCMHKSNDYVTLHNDNNDIVIIICSVSRTDRCVYVICGSDMHHYKFLMI